MGMVVVVNRWKEEVVGSITYAFLAGSDSIGNFMKYENRLNVLQE